MSVGTVRRWLRTRKLHGTRSSSSGYRITQANLQDFLQQHAMPQFSKLHTPSIPSVLARRLLLLLDLTHDAVILCQFPGHVVYWNQGRNTCMVSLNQPRVKNAADQLEGQGTIWVESEPGKGTTMSFSLPLSEAPLQETTREVQNNDGTSEA